MAFSGHMLNSNITVHFYTANISKPREGSSWRVLEFETRVNVDVSLGGASQFVID